jgi:hypothetical protein
MKQLPLAVQIRSEHRFDRIWRGKLARVAWLVSSVPSSLATGQVVEVLRTSPTAACRSPHFSCLPVSSHQLGGR